MNEPDPSTGLPLGDIDPAVEDAAARFLAAANYERGLAPGPGYLGMWVTQDEAARITASHGLSLEQFLTIAASIIEAYEADHGPWSPEHL